MCKHYCHSSTLKSSNSQTSGRLVNIAPKAPALSTTALYFAIFFQIFATVLYKKTVKSCVTKL